MRRKKSNTHRRGAAMVEMAIVLTLLLMVVLGAIEYGWLFLTMQKMTNAARHGARVAAAFGATEAEGQVEAARLLDQAGLDGKAAAVVEPWANGTVRATVTATTETVRLVHWDMLPVPETLYARVTMAKEGATGSP